MMEVTKELTEVTGDAAKASKILEYIKPLSSFEDFLYYIASAARFQAGMFVRPPA